MNKIQVILAVIGAGEGALPIVKKAKEMNVQTLAFGHIDSIAREFIDIFVESDIFDINFILSVCEKYNVSGIIASSEITTEIAAIIAARLKLPGNDVKHGFGAKNKYIMRTRIANLQSVKQPLFTLYKEGEVYDYPVVVKALDSCGKRGISIAYNLKDLLEAVTNAQLYSSNGQVLIEQYLEGGREYSIECIVGNDNYDIVQYTEKESSGPPHFIEIAHHQPANLSEALKKKIDIAVYDILHTLGITCGMAHLEIKVIEDEIYFIEIGARGGGDHIADMLTLLSTGFDYFKAAIDCSLGRYKHQKICNVAYSGIYFHCEQNKGLASLFNKATTAKWCIQNTVTNNEFLEASSNIETSKSGYFIYCADHKITNKDS